MGRTCPPVSPLFALPYTCRTAGRVCANLLALHGFSLHCAAEACERRDGGAMARSEVKSEISGRVWKLEARVGDRLAADETILILESMKMEIPVSAPAAGRVLEIRVAETDLVEEGQIVAVLETDDR